MATDKEKTFSYLTPSLKAKAKRLAEIRFRSLSSLIESVLAAEIHKAEDSGELPILEDKNSETQT